MKMYDNLGTQRSFYTKLSSTSNNELSILSTMWYHFYTCQRAKTKTSRLIKDVTDGVDMASIQEKPKGYWRRVFFKELASRNGSWKRKLKSIHSYTGLPIRTVEILRWAIKIDFCYESCGGFVLLFFFSQFHLNLICPLFNSYVQVRSELPF